MLLGRAFYFFWYFFLVTASMTRVPRIAVSLYLENILIIFIFLLLHNIIFIITDLVIVISFNAESLALRKQNNKTCVRLQCLFDKFYSYFIVTSVTNGTWDLIHQIIIKCVKTWL